MPRSSFATVAESLLEIDHCFVCLPTAMDASALADLGLNCSKQPLRRTGQGTSSHLIFFENIYLELIWVDDEAAAQDYAIQSGVNFQARAQRQASPFGIALRQTLDAVSRPLDLLPQSEDVDSSQTFINFATDNLRSYSEPLCFVIPDAVSLLSLLDRTSLLHQQMIRHPAGIRRLTSARVAVEPGGRFTDPVNLLRRDGIVEVVQGTMPLLELSFDHQQQRQTLDLRWLGIPVLLNY
jgi:Glyoxalase-like domain